LADYCYFEMFYECTALVNAPELPATSLAPYCYNQMFYKCTSLIDAPALMATNLAERCYELMFWKCYSLQKVEVGFTDWQYSPNKPTVNWLLEVSNSGTFICPAGLPKTYGADNIPTGWTVQAASSQ